MFLPFECSSCQAYFGKTAQDGFKDDFRFQPDERRSNAKVDPDAKAQVASLTAGNIETIWICETLGVTIGRAYNCIHQIPFPNQCSFDSGIFQGRAVCNLYRI